MSPFRCLTMAAALFYYRLKCIFLFFWQAFLSPSEHTEEIQTWGFWCIETAGGIFSSLLSFPRHGLSPAASHRGSGSLWLHLGLTLPLLFWGRHWVSGEWREVVWGEWEMKVQQICHSGAMWLFMQPAVAWRGGRTGSRALYGCGLIYPDSRAVKVSLLNGTRR